MTSFAPAACRNKTRKLSVAHFFTQGSSINICLSTCRFSVQQSAKGLVWVVEHPGVECKLWFDEKIGCDKAAKNTDYRIAVFNVDVVDSMVGVRGRFQNSYPL